MSRIPLKPPVTLLLAVASVLSPVQGSNAAPPAGDSAADVDCRPLKYRDSEISVMAAESGIGVELILKKKDKTLARQRLPAIALNSACLKLTVFEKEGVALMEFRRGTTGTKVLATSDALLVFDLRHDRLKLLRAFELRYTTTSAEEEKLLESRSYRAEPVKDDGRLRVRVTGGKSGTLAQEELFP